MRCAPARCGPVGTCLGTDVSLLKLVAGHEVLSKLFHSGSCECCETEHQAAPTASKRKKRPNLTLRASAHDYQGTSWVEMSSFLPVCVVMFKRWKQ